jgi:hypothetical protein
MLSEFFESRVRIQALRDGPAGSLLESFAQALSQAGYVRRIARRYLRAGEHFIYWTDRHGMPLGKVNEQSFARFQHHLSRCGCPYYGHADHLRVGRGARMFLTYLQGTSIITPPSSVKPTSRDPALLRRPSFERRRDFNPHEQRAAQRAPPDGRPRTNWSPSRLFVFSQHRLVCRLKLPHCRNTSRFHHVVRSLFSPA